MNTTKPQIKKPEIWDIAISKKVARDFVINNPTFDNSNNLIEKMREAGLIPDRSEESKASQEEQWIQDIWDSLDLGEQE